MNKSQFAALLAVIVVAWASLFTTNLTESSRTRASLSNEKGLLSQDNTIITEQKHTIDILSGKIIDLQTHVDCLFNLATQPNPAEAHISNASTCEITTSSPGGTTGSIKSVPMTNPTPPAQTVPPPSQNTNNGQSNSPPPPQPQPSPKPKPVKSLVCKLTLGLLAC